MIKIFGDLHTRVDKKPFDLVSQDMIDYIIKECVELSSKDTVILLGDLTDKSMVHGEVNALLVKLITGISAKIIIVHGNHTYTWNKHLKENSSCISFLKQYSHVHIVEEREEVMDIEGLKCLFLPHLKRNMLKNEGMKEYYERFAKENSGVSFDYIFGHIADETNTLFGNYVDLSLLKGRRILGHIHSNSEHYLGSMYSCNYGERNKDSYYMNIIDGEESLIKLPKWVDYYEINYGDSIDFGKYEAKYPIFDVANSPYSSEEDVKSHYSLNNLYIRNIYLKSLSNVISLEESENQETKNQEELFTEYIDLNSFNDKTKEYIKEAWNI